MTDYVLSCCSTADLSKEHFDRREIRYVCFHCTLGGTEYADDLGESLPPEELYRRMVAGEEAKTSQVSVGDYETFFEESLKAGKDILHVTLSTGISGTYNSACAARDELLERYPERKIYIVDSLGASSGYGLIMETLADKRDEGMPVEELYQWIEENKLNLHHWFFSADLTFTFFVLLCTVQSIQKRRYAVLGRGIKLGAYSTANILVAAALTIAINLGLNYVPDQYISIDVTANKMYTLTDDTVQTIKDLAEDVTIYVLADESSKDSDLDKTLQQFEGLSGHINVEYINPVANPKFYYKYTDIQPTGNSLIVVGPYDNVLVDYNNIYAYEFNYATYQNEITGYDGEGQIASAIARVSSEDIPKFYIIEGHNELPFDERFTNALDKENVVYETLSLYTVDAIPEDADGIIFNAPTSDYSTDDVDKVCAYFDKGGNALIVPTWTNESMDNFEQILGYYGVSVVDGMIVENDPGCYYQSPYYLIPTIEYDTITEAVANGVVFAPFARGLTYDEDSVDIYYQPLLTTSSSAFSKTDMSDSEDYRKSDVDIDGPFVIGMNAEKYVSEGVTSQAVIVATEQMFTANADDIVPGYNVKLFSSMVSSLAEREDSVAVPVKYYEIGNLIFSARSVYIVGFVSVIVLPIGCLIAGLVIWLRRRKK